jgi:hypothetical protein
MNNCCYQTELEDDEDEYFSPTHNALTAQTKGDKYNINTYLNGKIDVSVS